MDNEDDLDPDYLHITMHKKYVALDMYALYHSGMRSNNLIE